MAESQYARGIGALRLIFMLTSGFFLAPSPQAGEVNGKTVEFDILRQPLAAALTEFARQTGVQLLYRAKLSENLLSQPL